MFCVAERALLPMKTLIDPTTLCPTLTRPDLGLATGKNPHSTCTYSSTTGSTILTKRRSYEKLASPMLAESADVCIIYVALFSESLWIAFSLRYAHFASEPIAKVMPHLCHSEGQPFDKERLSPQVSKS